MLRYLNNKYISYLNTLFNMFLSLNSLIIAFNDRASVAL